MFAIQDEIARKVSEALKITLTSEEKSEVAKRRTSDVKAYDYYLRGRAYFDQFNLRSLTIARDMFERAIKEDTDYALAYAGLADCSSRLYQFFGQKSEDVHRALESSKKALSLDPELAEAHAARGLAFSLSKNYTEAEDELKKAIALSPNQFEAHEFLGRMYMAQGRRRDSADAFIRACEIRPDDYQSHIMVGRVIKGLDMEELRTRELKRGAELARERLENHPDDVRAMYLLAGVLVEFGQENEGFELAKRALSLNPDDPVLVGNVARLYVMVGEFDRAFVYLKQARDLGFSFKGWAMNDPDLAPIRSDPRFQEILDSIENPES